MDERRARLLGLLVGLILAVAGFLVGKPLFEQLFRALADVPWMSERIMWGQRGQWITPIVGFILGYLICVNALVKPSKKNNL